jgi:hypothetical protein
VAVKDNTVILCLSTLIGGIGQQDETIIQISEGKNSLKDKKKLRTQINIKFNYMICTDEN